MNVISEFKDNKQEWEKICAGKPWSLFIYGGEKALSAEDRCLKAFNQFSGINGINTFGISRTESSKFSFIFQINNEQEKIVKFYDLNKKFGQCLKDKGGHLMLDITSLELDIILYLIPMVLELNPLSLFCLYLVPKKYDNKESGLDLQTIQQPRGYVSFTPGLSGERKAKHFIIAGFDKGRASRFIEKYDWDWAKIHAIIGNPSYIPGGVNTALNSNKDWLESLDHSHKHNIAAHDALHIKEFFAEHLNEGEMLYIIPLGPKGCNTKKLQYNRINKKLLDSGQPHL